MGLIWCAEDRDLRRIVAVKSLRPEFLQDSVAHDRLARETAILAELSHPGICPIYDRYLLDDPPAYTMSFVDGETLQARIQALHDPAGATGFEDGLRELLRVIVSVCNTIEFAHSRGYLHRDIKPQNILVGKFGEVFVMDWGLASSGDEAALDDAEGNTLLVDAAADLTQPGQALGTPAFMAPEQFRAGRTLDVRTDVFGIGATLFASVTGRAPRESDAEHSGDKREHSVPPLETLGSRVPRDLRECCRKALSLDPRDRYQTVESLREDLERFLRNDLVSAAEYSRPERLLKWRRRHRSAVDTAVTAAVLFLILALVGLGVYVRNLSKARELAETRGAERSMAAGDALLLIGQPWLAYQQFKEASRFLPDLEDRLSRSLAEANTALVRWSVPSAVRSITSLNRKDQIVLTQVGELELFRFEPWTGRRLMNYVGLRREPLSVAVSPDDRLLIAGAFDGEVRVWDLESAEPVVTIDPLPMSLSEFDSAIAAEALAWIDSETFAVARGAHVEAFTIRGERRWHRKLRGPVQELACSGGRLLVGGNRLRLAMLSALDGTVIWTNREGEGSTGGVAFSADKSRVVTCSHDRRVRIYDAQNGDLLGWRRDSKFTLDGTAVGSSDQLLVGARDGEVFRYDLTRSVALDEPERGGGVGPQLMKSHFGHEARVSGVVQLASGSFVTADREGGVAVWTETEHSLGSRIRVTGTGSTVETLTFHPSGELYLVGTSAGELALFHASTHRELLRWPASSEGLDGDLPASHAVTSAVFDATGEQLMVGTTFGDLTLWDLRTSERRWQRRLPKIDDTERVANAAVFLQERTQIAAVDRRGFLTVWDRDSGYLLHDLPAHTAHPRKGAWGLGIDPKGRYLFTTGHDNAPEGSTNAIWDLPSLELRHRFRGDFMASYHPSFHRDGSRVVVSDWKGWVFEVPVSESGAGEIDYLWRMGDTPVLEVALHPDHERIALVGYDGSVRTLHRSTRRDTVLGTYAEASRLALSPDGRMLLAAIEDGQIVAFDLEHASRYEQLAIACTEAWGRAQAGELTGDDAADLARWFAFRGVPERARALFASYPRARESFTASERARIELATGQSEQAAAEYRHAKVTEGPSAVARELILQGLQSERR